MLVVPGGGDLLLVKLPADQPAPSLGGLPASGVVDQDPSHGLGGGGEEVPTPPPVQPLALGADEAEIRLVDEVGGLEHVPGGLPGDPRPGQRPELVVDQRQ